MNQDQEETQFLGLYGIFQESLQIISAWRKIFTQISIAFILPLSFVYLAHILLSDYLFSDIIVNLVIFDRTRTGSRFHDKASDNLASDWSKFILYNICYFVFFLVLSLLSTSAVVYTIACIHTARDINFKKVVSVVPKVWKRLIITFLWSSGIIFVYNVLAVIVMGVFGAIFFLVLETETLGILLLVVLLVIYLVGFAYISLIWQLASVVSVLEDVYGLEAMRKSQGLIKGKIRISVTIFLIVGVCAFGIYLMFESLVVSSIGNDIFVSRIFFAVLCLMLETGLMLLGFMVQTIIYFVCKSYHHENIDKSSLSDHLEVYLGEYVPLKSSDVQLEHFQL